MADNLSMKILAQFLLQFRAHAVNYTLDRLYDKYNPGNEYVVTALSRGACMGRCHHWSYKIRLTNEESEKVDKSRYFAPESIGSAVYDLCRYINRRSNNKSIILFCEPQFSIPGIDEDGWIDDPISRAKAHIERQRDGWEVDLWFLIAERIEGELKAPAIRDVIEQHRHANAAT